jgi:2-polyprenyl-3-methyl-5-hydroxy-6-metoxy-1,4-benzoquinol methylase
MSDTVTNADAIAAWSTLPDHLIGGFGEEGDLVRKHMLNPAIFTLLGDIRDMVILDAGCGQGYLARLLSRQGAHVTGLEPADALVAYAQKREQDEALGITYIQADLSSWTPIPNTFDHVIANMVLMDILDYLPALANCVTALKPAGRLILSILHPCFEESGAAWKDKRYVATSDYFEEKLIKQSYGHFIHRSLSSYLNAIIHTGCTIREVREPQLDYTVAMEHDAERYWSVPGYLVIAAVKNA